MTDSAGGVDPFKSVDASDPPGRVPVAADLTLPRLPGVAWGKSGRRKRGRRIPPSKRRKAVER